jgi:hypothetical protein
VCILRNARWIVALGMVAAIGAGESYAAIPSANGTISVCLEPNGGLRVIDIESGASCAPWPADAFIENRGRTGLGYRAWSHAWGHRARTHLIHTKIAQPR